MTLADLVPGDTATVEQIDTRDPGVIKLMILVWSKTSPYAWKISQLAETPWKWGSLAVLYPCERNRPVTSRFHGYRVQLLPVTDTIARAMRLAMDLANTTQRLIIPLKEQL